MVLKGINKDRKKEYRFFLFFNSDKDEKKTRIHASNQLSTAFLQEDIQSSITYKIKVNNERANTVIDLSTNWLIKIVCHKLSYQSGYFIAQIRWSSGSEKKYGFMIIYFTGKKEADKVLAKRLIEVEGENACAIVWIDKPGI